MNWEEELFLGKTALNKGLISNQQFQEAYNLFRELGGQIPFSGILIQKGSITMEQAKYLQESLNQEGRIGEYRLMEKLGEGGMGAVYRALHIPSREIRALKILLPQVSRDVQIVQRFIQEGRAASLLNHPGVVKCYEVKRWNTTFYMAMEYVQGESLDKVIEREGALTEKESLRIIRSVVEVLDVAWDHKIVHRDIKPENILISHQGEVKLADFGLAKLKSSKGMSLTQTGFFIGTPWFISPEQARGEKEIDTRSDIYSLGITLFQMVTGFLPFDSDSALIVCQKHLNEPLPSPQQFNPQVTPQMTKLLKKMTAKKQSRRPQNPAEMLELIDMVSQGTFPSTTRESTLLASISAYSTPSSSPWKGMIVLFLMALLLGVGGYYYWNREKVPSAKPRVGKPNTSFLIWKKDIERALRKNRVQEAYKIYLQGEKYRSQDVFLYDSLASKVEKALEQSWKNRGREIKEEWRTQKGFIARPSLLAKSLQLYRGDIAELASCKGLAKLHQEWEGRLRDLTLYKDLLEKRQYSEITKKFPQLFSFFGREAKGDLVALAALKKEWKEYKDEKNRDLFQFSRKKRPFEQSHSPEVKISCEIWKSFLQVASFFSANKRLFDHWEWIYSEYKKLAKIEGPGKRWFCHFVGPLFAKEIRSLSLLVEMEHLRSQSHFAESINLYKKLEKKFQKTHLFKKVYPAMAHRKACWEMIQRHEKIVKDYRISVEKKDKKGLGNALSRLETFRDDLVEIRSRLRNQKEETLCWILFLEEWRGYMLTSLHRYLESVLFLNEEQLALRVKEAAASPWFLYYTFANFFGQTSKIKEFITSSNLYLPFYFKELLTDLWMYISMGEFYYKNVAYLKKPPQGDPKALLSWRKKFLNALVILNLFAERKRLMHFEKNTSPFHQAPCFYSSLFEPLSSILKDNLSQLFLSEKESETSLDYTFPGDLGYFFVRRGYLLFRHPKEKNLRGLYGTKMGAGDPLIQILPGSAKKLTFKMLRLKDFEFTLSLHSKDQQIRLRMYREKKNWTLAIKMGSQEKIYPLFEIPQKFSVTFQFRENNLSISLEDRKVARYHIPQNFTGASHKLQFYFQNTVLFSMNLTVRYSLKSIEHSLREVLEILSKT